MSGFYSPRVARRQVGVCPFPSDGNWDLTPRAGEYHHPFDGIMQALLVFRSHGANQRSSSRSGSREKGIDTATLRVDTY